MLLPLVRAMMTLDLIRRELWTVMLLPLVGAMMTGNP